MNPVPDTATPQPSPPQPSPDLLACVARAAAMVAVHSPRATTMIVVGQAMIEAARRGEPLATFGALRAATGLPKDSTAGALWRWRQRGFPLCPPKVVVPGLHDSKNRPCPTLPLPTPPPPAQERLPVVKRQNLPPPAPADRRCQWIFGEPTGGDDNKCPDQAEPGTNWCPEHRARVYVTVHPKACDHA